METQPQSAHQEMHKSKPLVGVTAFLAVVCLILIVILWILVYTGNIKYQNKNIEIPRGVKGIKGQTGLPGPMGIPGKAGHLAPFENFQSGEIEILPNQKDFEIQFPRPYTDSKIEDLFVNCVLSVFEKKESSCIKNSSIILHYDENSLFWHKILGNINYDNISTSFPLKIHWWAAKITY